MAGGFFPPVKEAEMFLACVVVVSHGWARMVAAGVSSVCSNGRVRFQIRNIDWALRGQ